MKSNFVNITFILLLFSFTSYAQAPQIIWQKSFGGTNWDFARSIIKTTDGGYIVAGDSRSNNGDVIGNQGGDDCWVLKLSPDGNIQWQKSLGGTQTDNAHSIRQTTDGGYIVAGWSVSIDGDVTGNHGSHDYWVVKLSPTGDIQWQKSLGGIDNEDAYSIVQTTDGGYIVAGDSSSNNGDVTGNHGGYDYWVVKLSSTGDIQWQKSLGGTSYEGVKSINQTTDGGYIVAGSTYSNDGDVTGNHGVYDCWVVKLSPTGAIQWQKALGGTQTDNARSIIQTIDGGYIFAGSTESNDGDVTGNHGFEDFWVVKLSPTGDIQWQRALGGTSYDSGFSIIQTNDGSYIVAGYSSSVNGDATGNNGGTDFWIVKLSTTGAIEWQKLLGGTSYDDARSINQITDGESYIVGGYSTSNNGDVTGNHGLYDYWIAVLSSELDTTIFKQETTLQLSPNPTKENIMIQLDYYTPSQEILITDIHGKTIKNQKLDGLTTTINVSSFEKGIYLLTLFSEGNKTTQKFIVE